MPKPGKGGLPKQSYSAPAGATKPKGVGASRDLPPSAGMNSKTKIGLGSGRPR